jgi:hypothetical protein
VAPDAAVRDPTGVARFGLMEAFLWTALPACASVALLSVTAHICQDLASVPLLWIGPMVVYLATFIAAFASDRWRRRTFWLPVFGAASYAVVAAWFVEERLPYAWQVGVHLVLLASLCMVCHGEAAGLRPEPSRLTAFYLFLAAGGALGGVLAGVVAPRTLEDQYELPLCILAAWVLAVAVMITDPRSRLHRYRSVSRLGAIGALWLALAAGMGYYEGEHRSNSLATARNFYGVLQVHEPPVDKSKHAFRQLYNGRISHGAQFLEPARRRQPTQYYHRESGVGLVLGAPHDRPRRVGLIGLGAGTLASYADAGETFVFYEINPRAVEFANRYFTYLADARERGAWVTVCLGDARLSLEHQAPQQFDVLAVDAFNSDSIPAHLLTREAFALYLRHVKDPDGVLAVHVSNLYMRLDLVALAAAEHFGLDAVEVDAGPGEEEPVGSRSVWALLHREPGYFADRGIGVPLADAAAGRPSVTWTDDFHNVVQILTYGHP